MELKEIRWKQRFENFHKAFLLLEKSMTIVTPSDTERAGIIQFFEIAYELAWKMLKDYLESEGTLTRSPRETIKTAFQYGIITEGHEWLDALEDRNLTVHTYEESTAQEILEKIQSVYFIRLKELHDLFLQKLQTIKEQED